MTTETTTDLHAITAQDRRALRSADSVSFGLYRGVGYIRAHRDAEHTSSGFADYHEIRVTTRVHDYAARSAAAPSEATDYDAFHLVNAARFHMTWPTLLAQIAPDSTLSLLWTRNNQSPALDAAHMVRDELHLTVTTKRGIRRTFLVAVSVGPDNTARMIRLASHR